MTSRSTRAHPLARTTRRRRRASAWGTSLALTLAALVAACGGEAPIGPEPEPENVAPTVRAVPDQAVPLNTRSDAVLVIELQIQDPDDDELTVSVTSDDEAVIASAEVTCAPGPCPLTLPVVGAERTQVSVTVTVFDGRGGSGTATFVVHVRPRLVTTTQDVGAGSLRSVVRDAQPGDVIAFDVDGVFATPQTIELLAQIILDTDVTIEGPGADRVTVSGSGVARVFRVQGGADVSVTGVTIADGVASNEQLLVEGQLLSVRVGGGALVTEASRLTLVDVVVTGSSTPPDATWAIGGGVANVDATLVARRTELRGNQAVVGGGLGTVATGSTEVSTTLDGVIVQGNVADEEGGGIASTGGNMLVRGSQILDNEARTGGGVSSGGSLVIESASLVKGNTAAERGGGIWIESGTATLTESEVSSNEGREGGGIYVEDGSVGITSATIEENGALIGGGLVNDGELQIGGGSSVTANTVTSEGMLQAQGGGLSNTGVAEIVDTELVTDRKFKGPFAAGGEVGRGRV